VFNVGVIGTGIFATKDHLPALLSLSSSFKIVAACNRSNDKLQAFGNKAGLPANRLYNNYQDLLKCEDIQVVLISSPADLNAEIAIAAANHKKHILIEKPIAATLYDARKMIQVAKDNQVVLMIAENFIFKKNTILVAKLVESGFIGKAITFQFTHTRYWNPENVYLSTPWRTKDNALPGGWLCDGGVHDVAVITEALGKVSDVSAFTKQVYKEYGTDDTLSATLKMENGAIGTMILSLATAAPEHFTFTIFGEKGTIEVRGNDVRVLNEKGEPQDVNKIVEIDPSVLFIDEEKGTGVKGEWKHFYDELIHKEGHKSWVPGEKGFHHFAVFVAAINSTLTRTIEKVESV